MSEESVLNANTIPTSEENQISSSGIPPNEECIILTSEEVIANNSSIISLNNDYGLVTIPMSEQSQNNSSYSTVVLNEESEVNSCLVVTSRETNAVSVETKTTSADTKTTSAETKTTSAETKTTSAGTSTSENSFTDTTSEDSETSSSSISIEQEIEEPILKMIKHIEKGIKSDDHSDLNENDFQNVEIKIKTSRVMAAIEQTIKKLEIAFCLQWIFVENLYDISELYGEANMNKLINEYCKVRDVEDMDVCRYQPIVIDCISNALEAGFGVFVEQHLHKLPEAETKFLSTMVQFKYMAEWQMGMSAMKAMNKEKTLHKMWTANEKMKSKINEMDIQFESNKKKLQELLDEKNNIIEKHNQTISDLERHNTNEINAEIFKSNKAMRRVCLVSEEKQKILSAEVEQIKETYEKLIQNNLMVEKKLRDQKSKTRQKLQAVLTKYDNGVGERFAELMRIRNELEEETALYENKVKEFQLQEIEYNQIMADKAEVDAKIREEKLILFMMNRSARIIQRAYKKMMKKRKKGKKGKKAKKKK